MGKYVYLSYAQLVALHELLAHLPTEWDEEPALGRAKSKIHRKYVTPRSRSQKLYRILLSVEDLAQIAKALRWLAGLPRATGPVPPMILELATEISAKSGMAISFAPIHELDGFLIQF